MGRCRHIPYRLLCFVSLRVNLPVHGTVWWCWDLGKSNVHSFFVYYTRSVDNFVIFHLGITSPFFGPFLGYAALFSGGTAQAFQISSGKPFHSIFCTSEVVSSPSTLFSADSSTLEPHIGLRLIFQIPSEYLGTHVLSLAWYQVVFTLHAILPILLALEWKIIYLASVHHFIVGDTQSVFGVSSLAMGFPITNLASD